MAFTHKIRSFIGGPSGLRFSIYYLGQFLISAWSETEQFWDVIQWSHHFPLFLHKCKNSQSFLVGESPEVFSPHANFVFWKSTYLGDHASFVCLKIGWAVAKLCKSGGGGGQAGVGVNQKQYIIKCMTHGMGFLLVFYKLYIVRNLFDKFLRQTMTTNPHPPNKNPISFW